MANRRMFSKAVISSGRFLRLPQSSRLLYYDLGMAADDDGVVEAFSVIRSTGSTEDDLRVLAAREFVVILNDDLVTYITAWNENNYIRPDRYTPSIYSPLLVKVKMLPESSSVSAGDQLPTVGIPNDNRCRPQVRIGKDRLGKGREAEDSSARPDFNTIEVYAANNLRSLSPGNMQELASFKEELSEDMIQHAIDEACAAGKPSFGYARTIMQRYLDAGFKSLGDVVAAEITRRATQQPKQAANGPRWG